MHILMERNRVSKSCVMVELCFHRVLYFDCVAIYIFGFHHKQCACHEKGLTFMTFASQLISQVEESLKDETRLLMR